MRRFARAVWVVLAALAFLAAVAGLNSLPDAIARYSVEPEDVYGLAVIAALFLFLSGLWASLAWQTRRRASSERQLGQPRRGIGAAALLIVFGVLIIALGLIDPMYAPIMTGIGGVAMVSAALFLWLGRNGDRALASPDGKNRP